MGFRNLIQKRKDARRTYEKYEKQQVEKRDGAPSLPSVTIVTTRASCTDDDVVEEEHPNIAYSFSPSPVVVVKALQSSLRPRSDSMSSVASCTTASSSKKSVRFCIENVSVNPGEDTPVEDILQQLDEMLISDKRAHKRRKGNSSIAISVQDNHDDNIIEVEVKSPAVEKKISDDMRDESFSVDRGCHHFTTSMGCIDIDLSKHVDDLLESTIQNSQKAWKELRQATKSNSYSSNEEVMYRVMCYMDKQSHLLEETGAAMDETASWLQRGEGVVAELQASTQYFGDAILLSMGCQTDEKDIHHRRSKHERKGEAFLYPQSSE